MAKRMYGSTANIDEVNAHTDELVEDIANNYRHTLYFYRTCSIFNRSRSWLYADRF